MQVLDVLLEQHVFSPGALETVWQSIQASLIDVRLEPLDITPSGEGIIFRAAYSDTPSQHSQIHVEGTLLFSLSKTDDGMSLRQLHVYSKR
jgi:hypothetical protein